jgi:phosphoheptose isomerase
MDEFEDPLQAMFTDHVDCVYRTLDAVMRPLDTAVDRLCQAMLEDRRVLVYGTGTATGIAQLFSALLLAKSRIDRPGLPAINLGADAIALSAIEQHFGVADIYARQIQAIGQPGDCLVVVAGPGESFVHDTALRVARTIGIDSVLVGCHGSDDIETSHEKPDIELRIQSADPARLAECQLLILNCMIALIETRLFSSH